MFDFIRQRIHNSFPPSLSEIAAHFGFSNKNAYNHLWALRKKGYIDWEDGKPRTLSLLPPYKDDTWCSLVVNTDIPHLGIQKGSYLIVDTGNQPVAEGEVIVSTQGEIKRFATGDMAFGRVIGVSRELA